jgi:hypothetical protein
MTVLRFARTGESHKADDPQLAVAFQEPDQIQRGAGVHRLRFLVKLDSRGTLPAGIPLGMSVQISVGGSNDWLGFAQPVQPVVTNDKPFDEHLILPLSDEQLAIIEERRAGSDLAFNITFGVTLGYRPDSWPQLWPSSFPNDQTVWIQSGAWQRLLAQSSSGMSLAIVVPVPLGKDSAATRTGDHLRTALRKVNAGDYDDAVIAARKAIEAFDASDIAWSEEKTIVTTTRPQDRTGPERQKILRHALFSLASPAAHGDDDASAFHWDRASAMSVIAGVSALVATFGNEPST